MLEQGQLVLYGIHGVCRICGIETKKVDRKKVDFYILSPLDQENACFYIPTHNEIAVSKLRPLLTRQELETLVHSPEANRDAWIVDENQRKMRYRELISSGDRAALISMVRSLLRHKQSQLSAGKKFHLCDENFLRDAQKLLSAEFSLVLQIPADEVTAYLQEHIEA